MCSVGDGFNIDLSEDTGLCEYRCNDCGNTFKGVRIDRKLKCSKCRSNNTEIVNNPK